MLVYTVTKPVGTKDREFEAYTRLLEEVGIDVSNSPRVPEPGTDRRWLYAWKREIEAARVAGQKDNSQSPPPRPAQLISVMPSGVKPRLPTGLMCPFNATISRWESMSNRRTVSSPAEASVRPSGEKGQGPDRHGMAGEMTDLLQGPAIPEDHHSVTPAGRQRLAIGG